MTVAGSAPWLEANNPTFSGKLIFDLYTHYTPIAIFCASDPT